MQAKFSGSCISLRQTGLPALALILALTFCPAGAMAGMLGPIVPYFGPADSPFSGLPGFQLDTFETSGLPVGVTASAGLVIGPGPLVDSVEGPGDLGHSFFSGSGAAGITFTFDPSVLGGLPTAAGIVWTDGDGPNRTFQAFDAADSLIGTIIDPTELFYSTGGDDTPSNYRFFGAENAGGISSIFISNDGGGIEVDDLQFVVSAASSTPEPNTAASLLFGVGLLFTGALLRRGQRHKVG